MGYQKVRRAECIARALVQSTKGYRAGTVSRPISGSRYGQERSSWEWKSQAVRRRSGSRRLGPMIIIIVALKCGFYRSRRVEMKAKVKVKMNVARQ